MLRQENPRPESLRPQDPFKIGDILFGGGNAGCGNPDLALGRALGASRTNLLNFCLSRPITLCSIHLNSATTSLKLTFDSPDSEIGSIAAFKGTALPPPSWVPPFLPTLSPAGIVDQAIVSEDEVLYRIADRVKNFAVIYVCGLDQVKDFNQMYAVRPHDGHVLLQEQTHDV